MSENSKKILHRVFLYVCGVIILYWFLHETDRVRGIIRFVSSIFAPFIFGGVLAFILNVPLRVIEGRLLCNISNQNVKRIVAVLITFFILFLVITLVFWLLIPQLAVTIHNLVPNLSAFLQRIEDSTMDFFAENPKLHAWLKENMGLDNIGWFDDSNKDIVGSAVTAIGSIFSGAFDAVIAIVFSIYCLVQKETLARQGRKLVYAYLKEKTADKIIRVLRLTNMSFSNFLTGQCLEVCILGVMFAVAMAIFRMPYIPLISLVIAVTAFVPIVGAWAGCVLGTFLIFVESPMMAVWFVVLFLILQQIENNLIYPRVVGNSVGLPGMWVLVAVAVGGSLMGVLGMFLMIPIASVVHKLLKEHTNKRLEDLPIDPKKLQPQPPKLKPRRKKKQREKRKMPSMKMEETDQDEAK